MSCRLPFFTPPHPRHRFLLSRFSPARFSYATHRDLTHLRRSSRPPPPPRPNWLDSLDSNIIFYAIIAANAGVYLTWTLARDTFHTTGDPTLFKFMLDNFRVSLPNFTSGRVWTLVTSAFSHTDSTHILLNGLTFYFMAPAVMRLLGNSHFLRLYFLGGISASLASLGWNHYYKHENSSSLGASGAILATLALYSCAFPRNTFLIFFVIPCPAWAFLPGVLVYDALRSFSNQPTKTDAPGHVGGLLSGVGYFLWRVALRR